MEGFDSSGEGYYNDDNYNYGNYDGASYDYGGYSYDSEDWWNDYDDSSSELDAYDSEWWNTWDTESADGAGDREGSTGKWDWDLNDLFHGLGFSLW
jgi:hypothetical protein